MFDDLSARLAKVLKRLRGQGTIRERHLDETLSELRLVLLEADVEQGVVSDLVAGIREQALGAEVMASLSPGQHVIKIVRDELTRLLGDAAKPLALPQQRCGVVMLVGLQGSGKTTTAAKLARSLKEHGKVAMLVSADFSRPAAREQLAILGEQAGVKVFTAVDSGPLDAVKAAEKEASVRGYDALLVDTAGRLHVDDALMAELRTLAKAAQPCETLFVGDAMTGQDAVRSAAAFDAAVPLTGIVLTKLDGDARGGAALSMARVTGKPLRYVGVGEKLDDLQVFQPDRLVSRLLGMGDVLSLIERAEKVMDKEQAAAVLRKARRGKMTLEDFRDQLRQVRKLGSIEQVMDMIPGGAGLRGKVDLDERWSLHAEAIINSMTAAERRQHALVDASRKRRIARGAGRPLSEVNRLLKSFKQARELHQRMLTRGPGGFRMPSLPRSR